MDSIDEVEEPVGHVVETVAVVRLEKDIMFGGPSENVKALDQEPLVLSCSA